MSLTTTHDLLAVVEVDESHLLQRSGPRLLATTRTAQQAMRAATLLQHPGRSRTALGISLQHIDVQAETSTIFVSKQRRSCARL